MIKLIVVGVIYPKVVQCNNFIIERNIKNFKSMMIKKFLIINQLSVTPTRLGFKNKDKYYSYNGMAGKLTHTVKMEIILTISLSMDY